MTADSLRALVASGESLALEFKSDERAPLNDRDLIEAVVCLANRVGQLDPSSQVTASARWEDLDPLEFERFRRSVRERRGRSDESRLAPGSDWLEQEKWVVGFAEKHGRIARAEAAELCGLSPDRAYRLLSRLRWERRLVRRGERKRTWYELRG